MSLDSGSEIDPNERKIKVEPIVDPEEHNNSIRRALKFCETADAYFKKKRIFAVINYPSWESNNYAETAISAERSINDDLLEEERDAFEFKVRTAWGKFDSAQGRINKEEDPNVQVVRIGIRLEDVIDKIKTASDISPYGVLPNEDDSREPSKEELPDFESLKAQVSAFLLITADDLGCSFAEDPVLKDEENEKELFFMMTFNNDVSRKPQIRA